MKTYHPNSQMVNIREGVERILTTVVKAGQPLKARSLCQHLKGEARSSHSSLNAADTFGGLQHYHPCRIQNLVNYLLNQGFLNTLSQDDEAFGISNKGLDYLRAPSDLMVSTRELNLSAYDHELRSRLLTLRQQLSETANLPAFRIFTEYTIQRVVQDRPRTLAEIEGIPGMGAYKAGIYGEAILELVSEVEKKQYKRGKAPPQALQQAQNR